MAKNISKMNKDEMYDQITENCKVEIHRAGNNPEYQVMLCGIYEEILPMLKAHEGCPDELLKPLAESDTPLYILNNAVSFKMMCEHYGVDSEDLPENGSDEPIPFA